MPELRCTVCGRMNRVRSFKLHAIPICGSCASELNEPRLIAIGRTVAYSPITAGAFLTACVLGYLAIAYHTAGQAPGTSNVLPPGFTLDAQGPVQSKSNLKPVSPSVASPMPVGVIGVYGSQIAPLEVQVPDNGLNYYFKLVKGSGLIAEFFVASGQSIKLHVPLGTFDLRFAMGRSWYGYQDLFGVDTQTFELSRSLLFSDVPIPNGVEHRGHTIRLEKFRDGNIGERRIDRNAF